FWIARRIMAGYEWRGERPFANVYFTGIVRDKLGRKMSKQLGNSPDPLDLIAKYGADGMRIAMLMSASAGNDVMFDEALCEQGRNFCNKIWNAYRLVNMWAEDSTIPQPESSKAAIEWFDEVMLERIERINNLMAQYRISEAFTELYRLFWDDFSGWYLEIVKPAYQAPIDSKTLACTKHYFDQLLRLMHPFMPFVTEEIWQDLRSEEDVCSIVIARQPEAERKANESVLARFALAEEVITAIRNIRKQKNIAQKEALALNYIADENFPAEYAAVIAKMGNLSAINAVEEKDATAAAFIVKTTQYFVPMEGNINKEEEIKKLTADLEYYEGFLASVMKKLSNERFVSSAPENVVANERAKQSDAEAKIAAIKEQIAALS
ncbi:MAG: class I tRNA ligase family protein, partial [Alistipes sp.]|nr:class I tRNA ligase family protein [Alistipes sp.]